MKELSDEDASNIKTRFDLSSLKTIATGEPCMKRVMHACELKYYILHELHGRGKYLARGSICYTYSTLTELKFFYCQLKS